MKIAQAPIQSHSPLPYWNGGQIALGVLGVSIRQAFAGAVDASRPRVRGRQLKPVREAPLHPRLQGMVGRIAIAGAYPSLSKHRVKTLIIQLPWIEIHACRQLVAHRANVGRVEKHIARKLALESEGPALSVRISKILIERAALGVRRLRRISTGGYPRQPVAVSTTGCESGYLAHSAVRREGGKLERDDLVEPAVIADLEAAAPNRLPVAKQWRQPAGLERRRPGQPKSRAEIVVVHIDAVRYEILRRIKPGKRWEFQHVCGLAENLVPQPEGECHCR